MTFKIEVLYKPFADQVRGKLKWDGDMRAIIDARLGSKYPVYEYNEVIEIALQCTIYDRNDRPKMQVACVHIHIAIQTLGHTNLLHAYRHTYLIYTYFERNLIDSRL